jgi:hypothetical protein
MPDCKTCKNYEAKEEFDIALAKIKDLCLDYCKTHSCLHCKIFPGDWEKRKGCPIFQLAGFD